MKSKQLVLIVLALSVCMLVGSTCSVFQRKNELVIGAVLPMTGDAAKYGKWTQQGAQLAIDEVNAQDGMNGRRLVLQLQDSQTNPASGTSAFQQIQAAYHPIAVLTTLTSVSRALIPLAESNRVVLFANATLPGLTDGHQFVFRNISSLASDIPAMVSYAEQSLKKPRVAILWRNDEFGVWGSKEFARLYTGDGGVVAESVAYDPKADDFRTHIEKIARSSPDAVYLLGYSEVGKIARQAWELGHKWQFLGITTMGDPEASRLAGGALEGAVYTEATFAPSSSDPKIAEFRRKYHDRFGEDPEVWAATFYDAVNLIVAASQGKEPTADNLRNGLLGIRDFPGVSGSTTFLANGDVQKAVQLKTIKGGQPTLVGK